MDIHQLELFLAVMESPSMTRAAQKVFLSPGAVSRLPGAFRRVCGSERRADKRSRLTEWRNTAA